MFSGVKRAGMVFCMKFVRVISLDF